MTGGGYFAPPPPPRGGGGAQTDTRQRADNIKKAIEIGRVLLAKISEEYIVISEIGQFIIILTIVLASSFASFHFIEKPANVLVKKWFGCSRNKIH
jgi:uncharacterized membrane protein YjdF